MPDLSKTIEIIFAGTDKVSDVIDSIDGSMSKIGSGMQDISAPFADAAEQVLLLEAAIAAAAVAGVKLSSDLEEQSQKMKNALGLTTEEAERFGDIAKDVYTSGFGNDLAQSFDAVALAQQKFGDNASVDIGKVTEQALKLQSVFGTDYSESLSAVNTLMKNFGLSSDEAFNFIAAGYQKGLNGAGDFLESINEYSTQFANGGATAGNFFSVLETGFQEGMLGTDKAADAFKEFRVRIQDGSKTTQEALAQLGLGESFLNSLETGQISAINAFNIIIGKLNETENSSTVMQAGVGLLGTQFEDLGTLAALSINTTKTSMSDLQGVIDGIEVDTFEHKFTSALRTIQTEFGSLEQWDIVKDKVSAVFIDIAESFGPALEKVDFSGLEASVDELWNSITGVFTDVDFDLTTVEGAQVAIQKVIDTIQSLNQITSGMIDFFAPIASSAAELIEWFNQLEPSAKEAAGQILAAGTALGTIGTVLSAGGAVLSGLNAFGLAFTGPVGIAAAIAAGLISLAELGPQFIANNKDVEENTKKLQEDAEAMRKLVETARNLPEEQKIDILTTLQEEGLEAAQFKLSLIPEKTESKITINGVERTVSDLKLIEEYSAAASGTIDIDISASELAELEDRLSSIPPEHTVKIQALMNEGKYQEALDQIRAIPIDKELSIKTAADKASISESVNYIETTIDGKKVQIAIPVKAEDVDKAKKKIDELPTEKILEIKAQGEIDKQIAQITSQAETAQTALEWTAKLEIAKAEADAQSLSSTFEAMGETISAVSSSASDMFGSLLGSWNDLSFGDQFEFMNILEDQVELQQKLAESQIDLNNAQIKSIEAKTKALEKGNPIIQIESTGLEPALEMLFWQVFEKVQVRVNEEASELLLNI